MTWYIWLFIILVLETIVGGLMVLLRTAKPLPLSDEQLQRSSTHDVRRSQDSRRKLRLRVPRQRLYRHQGEVYG